MARHGGYIDLTSQMTSHKIEREVTDGFLASPRCEGEIQ
jgi:hypothetical protein